MSFRFPHARWLAVAAVLAVGFTSGVARAGESVSFRPALADDDGYSETFAFSIDMPEGSAQVQLAFTNAGPGSGRAVCRVFVVSPDITWRSQEVHSSSDWSQDRRGLTLGDCRLDAGYPLRLTAGTDDGSLRLTVHEPLVRLPLMKGGPDEGNLLVEMYAQGATATVELKADGKGAVTRPARVFVEHSLSTTTPDRIARRWYRFRTIDGGPVLGGLVLSEQPTGKARGRLHSDRGKATLLETLAVEDAEAAGREPLVFKDGEWGLRLAPLDAAVDYAPLREMGFLGRVLAAIVGDPLFTVVDVDWREGEKARRGRLEIITFR